MSLLAFVFSRFCAQTTEAFAGQSRSGERVCPGRVPDRKGRRKITAWAAAIWLMAGLLPAPARAGAMSRQTEFAASIGRKATVAENASRDPSGEAGWSYHLIPAAALAAADGPSPDYAALLAPARLQSVFTADGLVLRARQIDEKKRAVTDCMVSDENISLSWNRDEDPADGKAGGAAIVMKYKIPKTGFYSLRGNLSMLCEKPAAGAVLVIGVQGAGGFRTLVQHPFGQERPASEAKLFKVLDEEAAAQNLALSAGDALVWIISSPADRNLRLAVIDHDVRLIGEALPAPVVSASTARMLDQLDYSRPDLARVKQALDADNKDEAFTRYKSVLARRAQTLPEARVTYWLFVPAKADELLEGVVTTAHYGMSGTTTYRIGKPGAVDWFKIPEDGYEPAVRDIVTMQWSNKLAEAYAKTGDVRYLAAYLGYWQDLAENWTVQFERKIKDPAFRARVKGTVVWGAQSRLYNASRLETLGAGMQIILRRALADNALGAIPNEQLAILLNYFHFWEMPRSMRFLLNGGGVPNQQQGLAAAVFFFGVYLSDMKEAPSWREAALFTLKNSGGYLPDGTDMEQSINYNKGLPLLLDDYQALVPALPAEQHGDWVSMLERRKRDRHYFMQALVMPMGGQPICGKNNTWGEYDKPNKFLPGIFDKKLLENEASHLPLSAILKDRFYGEKRAAEPEFRSVYWPFGGYYVLRSDWSRDALYSFMKVSRPGNGHMQEEINAPTFVAFGRQLLINSASNAYSPKMKFQAYGGSSIGRNSIAVDGYGQQLRLEAVIPAVYDTPLPYRFLDGERFSFAEGTFSGLYGGWNFADPNLSGKTIIRDVRHIRQVVLLREEKCWIVTDVITSEREHAFTQTWNFPPDFKKEDVVAAQGVIQTHRAEDVNIALYPILDSAISFNTYHGFDENGRTLGWVALGDKVTGADASPAVDVHAGWRGQGRQVLITVVVPYKGANPVRAVIPVKQDKARGVKIDFTDGRSVDYLYGGAQAEAVLTTKDARLVLQPGGGYEETLATQKRNPVIVPAGFRWLPAQVGEKPDYGTPPAGPKTEFSTANGR